MRKGSEYTMPVKSGKLLRQEFDWQEDIFLPIPLELVSNFEGCSLVRWIDLGDGSFKLTVFDTIPDV